MTDILEDQVFARFDAIANARNDSDWSDVLRRSRRRQWAARPALIAAVVTLAAVLAAGATAYHFNVFVDSSPPGTEVASIGSLVLRADVGACGGALYLYDGNEFLSSEGGMPVRDLPDCNAMGGPPTAKHSVGYGILTRTNETIVDGVVSSDVTRLVITPREGDPVEPPLEDAPARLQTRVKYFLVRLAGMRDAASAVKSLSTFRADGTLIEHWKLPVPVRPHLQTR